VALGPFEVDPDQVQRLGPQFGAFVNRLLDTERAASGIRGRDLSITKNETTADGGVDAVLTSTAGTDWFPAGASAWQFKRSNLAPKACADEFAAATWAQEFVKAGGAYVLVLGHSLVPKLVNDRRKKVAAKAVELGLLPADDPERILVYDANALGRWASEYPALARLTLLQGPGTAAVAYERWSDSRWHQAAWVPDKARSQAIASIRAALELSAAADLRIQGDSGYGKTRLVLEALRDDVISPLVAYVHDEQKVDGTLLDHLVQAGRTAVLVVDECAAERHMKLAEQLPTQASVRLVTIGPRGFAGSRSPVIDVDRLPPEETDSFLKENFPSLSDEARRFITDHSDGNTRWTIVFAERLTGADAAHAADLIEQNDIEAIVTTLLPEGNELFFAAVLALVERVGWDRELRPQLNVLSAFAQTTAAAMEGVARDLEQRGLLLRQGRYRSVAPHPLAVFLAAKAWRTEGSRIVDELLPLLPEEMALGLFQRIADLGRFEPVLSVLPQLLGTDGPFGSLDALEHEPTGRQLTQLAIVLPDEVATHLATLLGAASLDDLRGRVAMRRDLVWTLEKLVWHRRTFKTAADSLLRLALAENETWANNATGTWLDLFGTLLPGTAAVPSERLAYLTRVSKSPTASERQLAIRACGRVLAQPHEHISVSGEIQGGVLVEPRGSARTVGEIREYKVGAINILRELTKDQDQSIADSASKQLIDAVHPLIDDPLAGESLFSALLELNDTWRVQLRRELEHLMSLHERNSGPNREQLVSRLRELSAALPPPSPQERLEILLQLRRWDFENDGLRKRIGDAIRTLAPRERDWVMTLVRTEQLAAAWELGYALAQNWGQDGLLVELVGSFGQNPDALLGYLQGLVDAGDLTAFDRFLGTPDALALDAQTRLAIAARGPLTEAARVRTQAMALELPVAGAARALFGWQRNLTDEEIATLANDWLRRLETQEDYNALLDWFPTPHEATGPTPGTLRQVARAVVFERAKFPELRQQSWEWSQLASQFVAECPAELAALIMDLVDADSLRIHRDDPESRLLLEAAKERPSEVWADTSRRLTDDSWKLKMEIRGWLLYAIPADLLGDWIGGDVERARVVASVAPSGASEPSDVARLLLDRFPDDEEIGSSLWGDFISGIWMGPESDRLKQQIEQMRAWQTPGASDGVRRWSAEMIRYLQQRLAEVQIREAEGGY
jgi:hypothetical protein